MCFLSRCNNPRPLSLARLNLVLVYKCGRIFPAGGGLDPPSRNSSNSLFSRYSRSASTWRRFGWLRMAFTRCASSELQIGTLRELVARGGHCRGKPDRAQQHRQAFRGTLYRVSKHQIRRGRWVNRYLMSQGSAEPLCTRIKDANREVSKGQADLLPRVCILPTRVNKKRRTGMISRASFRDAESFGRLDAESRACFTSSRPPPPWPSESQFSLFVPDGWP